MCGICGILAFKGPKPTLPRLNKMCDTIIHRGPDQDGMDIRDQVGLAMRRLAIIDLKGGKQPLFNEDGSIRTVFNGEIYNFRELRQELEVRGHFFRTNTDTEVIVHAYEEYGADFPSYLNGMFAIALHDSNTNKVILARDHIGIKPLYYYIDKNNLIFGSEIKAILASDLVTTTSLNLDSLSEFLAWEYVPGENTLFKDIYKLKPAQYLEINLNNGDYRIRSFWDLPAEEEDNLSAVEWEELVDAKIKESVRRQLVSDVPLGAFLSGGVDSSLIVAAMDHAMTFSIGFSDPSYNELPWSQKVADYLSVDHKYEIITPDITGMFDELLYFLDDPIGDFSIFPTYMVSKVARKHVTVSLSGDGGDELFGGYETYLADAMSSRYRKIPGPLRHLLLQPMIKLLRPKPVKKGLINKTKRFIEGLEYPADLSHCRWRVFAGEELQHDIFTGQAREQMSRDVYSHIRDLFSQAKNRQPLNRNLYVDLKSYLCDNILVKVDRMSMAVSLESRVPFLDPELVELAFRIPERYKISKGNTKKLLKRVAARHIPHQCVYRPKEGFSIPIKHWLTNELRPVMEDLLSPVRLKNQGIFESDVVDKLKDEHIKGLQNHSHLLWSLMVFQAWHQKWLER